MASNGGKGGGGERGREKVSTTGADDKNSAFSTVYSNQVAMKNIIKHNNQPPKLRRRGRLVAGKLRGCFMADGQGLGAE